MTAEDLIKLATAMRQLGALEVSHEGFRVTFDYPRRVADLSDEELLEAAKDAPEGPKFEDQETMKKMELLFGSQPASEATIDKELFG